MASVLHASGFHMGDELKPADVHNEAGYYEDLETLRLHESWLAKLDWDLGTVSERFPLEPTASMLDAIAAVVANREARGRPWGAKPPGVLFFWPAWRAALPARTVLLLPFRHPEAVARSYVAAGDTRERALALWLQLNKLALSAIDESPFEGAVLDFDRPEHVACRLSKIVGCRVTDTYLPDLHHHRVATPLDGEIRAMYAQLQQRAGTDRADDAPVAL